MLRRFAGRFGFWLCCCPLHRLPGFLFRPLFGFGLKLVEWGDPPS